MVHGAHFILYVREQARARAFYESVLGLAATLDVPGMTEFRLRDGVILGLMPETSIKRLLGEVLPDPGGASGVPRAELYLLVDDPARCHAAALSKGARELAGLAARDWGHEAAYSLDLDGHVLVFARALRHPGRP